MFTSAIDPTRPLDGVPAVKTDLRNNLQAAKTEIEGLHTLRSGEVNAFDFIPAPQHAAIVARTSTTDLSVELQTWMDAVEAEHGVGIWPAGVYNASVPLWVTRLPFQSSVIRGAGRGYTEALSQTTLINRNLVAPALIAQYARGVFLSGFAISGGNTAAEALDTLTADESDYLSPGVRSSRYSPNCAIAIDPFVGSVPPDGGYPGFTADYNNGLGGSAEIYLDKIQIRNFGVGVVASPNVDSSQGDGLFMQNLYIRGCDTAVSIGQSQTRGCVFSQGGIAKCRTAVTNAYHGQQNGAVIAMDKSQINSVYRLFECAHATDVVSLDKIYCESIKSIGILGFGAATTTLPLFARSCYFNIDTLNTADTAPLMFEGHAKSKWLGCFFSNIHPDHPMNFGLSKRADFDTCSFRGSWPDNTAAPIANAAGGVPARFTNCDISTSAGGVATIDADELTSQATLTALGNVSNVSIASGTITFDTTNAGAASIGQHVLWRTVLQGNSLVQHEVPALVITGISGNTVTCAKIFDDDHYDTTVWYGTSLRALAATTA